MKWHFYIKNQSHTVLHTVKY